LSGLGVLVFHASSGPLPDALGAWLFSLDQLLPIIKLDPRAEDIAKSMIGWRHIYLAAHRALGFILSSFVVAGLSGLSQE
jgi:hypothetical protein